MPLTNKIVKIKLMKNVYSFYFLGSCFKMALRIRIVGGAERRDDSIFNNKLTVHIKTK